jgi:hypothetical protein
MLKKSQRIPFDAKFWLPWQPKEKQRKIIFSNPKS